ncbi:hypothetical protein ACHHYP_03517 [Achlya hypogyna]|uniref:Uncharacterized protein n=1 Tax=Achlya hypogyna TaxID=1202772 RepID=A0A1V9Z3G6_ACHHY|nr:hypothetical protein ACHHYP_03517 [Achlya hypogyna]
MATKGYVVPDLDEGRPVRRKGSSAADILDETTPLATSRRKPVRGLWTTSQRLQLAGLLVLLWLAGIALYRVVVIEPEEATERKFPIPVLRPPLPPQTLDAVLEVYAMGNTGVDAVSLDQWQALLTRVQADTDPNPRAKWGRAESAGIQELIETRMSELLTAADALDAPPPLEIEGLDEYQADEDVQEPLASTATPPESQPIATAEASAAPTTTPLTATPSSTTPSPTTTPPPPMATTNPTTLSPETTTKYLKDLVFWVKADAGLRLVDAAKCSIDPEQCRVMEWANQAPGGASMVMAPTATTVSTYPILVQGAVHALPALYFTCPLALSPSRALLRDHMTLFFVLSPATFAQTSPQTFFGHTPYGQFRFHAQRASFFSAGEFTEAEDVDGLSPGAFAVLVYRLDGTVSIKVNGLPFGSERGNAPVNISPLETTVLGSAKRRIAEVLVYTSVLSDVAIDSVETYLMHKWDVAQGVTHHTALHTTPDDPMHPLATDAPASSVPNSPAALRSQGPAATRSHVAPKVTSALSTTPKRPATYDPNDVFKWTPPEDDPAAATEWKAAVAARIRLVEKFEFGGHILYEYIEELKDELNSLRSSLFPAP